jgi:DNA-binding Lrp family transcriptional regulator
MPSAMDDLDQRLIACLRDDARAPTTALAKALGVSRATVQSRIDRLRSSGVLLGFTVRLQPEAVVDRIRAFTSIEVDGPRSEAVLKALRAIPAVTAVHSTNGRWDFVAELETVNLEAFSQALDAIRAIQGIATTETSLLLKSHRF